MSLDQRLQHASSFLGRAAGAVERERRTEPRSTDLYERLIGIGIAQDWVGWARHLLALKYTKTKKDESDRAHGIAELTRFTFMWTAANALFARDSVLNLLHANANSIKSELSRYRVLFQSALVPDADQAQAIQTLHAILALEVKTRDFPWTTSSSPPTLVEIVYHKYTTSAERQRGIGRELGRALADRSLVRLDLPLLIYATRNWNIHGVLLSSSFRGTRKKFDMWIDTTNRICAAVLEGCARALWQVLVERAP